MIRVFVLAVLAFAALVAIARNLPDAPPSRRQPAGGVQELSIFSRWEGAWEGIQTEYSPDGAALASMSVRREHTSISPTEQEVVIHVEGADGKQEMFERNVVVEGRLESRVQMPDGSSLVLNGRQAGGVLFWYRRDETAGSWESRREEIVPLEDGDLLTVDGVRRRSAAADDLVILEGRYRRAWKDGD